MSESNFAPSFDHPYQWRESVLSTRSLSYISNAGSIIHPPGPQSRQGYLNLPSRKETMDSVSEDGDLVMTDRSNAVAMNDVAELPESVARSLLFELPREIRDRIYSLCLCVDDAGSVDWPRHWLLNNWYRLQPQLLRTCKIVHSEAAPLLYSNQISFSHPSDANVFVRAFASPIYGRQVSSLTLHIKAQDMRMWMPYITSTDDVRSLKADFLNLRELNIRFRSTKWHHSHTPEANLKSWSDDSRLDEVIDGLRHVFLQPEKSANEAEFRSVLARTPEALREGDREQFRDRLLQIHQARRDREGSRRSDVILRIVCACRVPPAHFNALTIPSVPITVQQLEDGTPGVPPLPVKEGEEFRGFSAVDLQKEVKKLRDSRLGSANVARTLYTVKKGIFLALEIHCMDPRDTTER